MTQDKLSFNVVGGPSKFDLMLSLFDGNKQPRRTVEFQLEGVRDTITAGITMVQQEDGSGESWNVEGWTTFNIKAYYCTRDRKGYLTFIVPFHYEMRDGVSHKVERPEDRLALEKYVDSLRDSLNRDFTDMIRNARRM